ncbi:hypothetical protein GQX74_014843 [Glossina fuscipes]|nr:hypothetical protein GQX74_014843 [Glossina fuscipes]
MRFETCESQIKLPSSSKVGTQKEQEEKNRKEDKKIENTKENIKKLVKARTHPGRVIASIAVHEVAETSQQDGGIASPANVKTS